MSSTRCRFIPNDPDECPGEVGECRQVSRPEECNESGGTVVTVLFQPAAGGTGAAP
jgi:hypothetical protein